MNMVFVNLFATWKGCTFEFEGSCEFERLSTDCASDELKQTRKPNLNLKSSAHFHQHIVSQSTLSFACAGFVTITRVQVDLINLRSHLISSDDSSDQQTAPRISCLSGC
jgi:hypothetical protein